MAEELIPTAEGPDESDDRDAEATVDELVEFFSDPVELRSIALTGLFLLALFFSLKVARGLFLPIVVALLLNFVLSPVVRAMRVLRIPRAAAAGLLVVGIVASAGAGLYFSFQPAQEWLRKVPQELRRVEYKIRDLTRPVEEVSKAADRVQEMTEGREGGSRGARRTVRVDQQPSLRQSLVTGAQEFFATVAIMLILLFFLLASGDFFLRKMVRVIPTLRGKKQAVTIARRMEREISKHLFAITCINTGLGVVIGVAMWLLDMPAPILWGIMACAFNFVPYLGAMVGTAIVGIVSFISFDSLGHSILVPVVYYGLTSLEGGVFTPIILGRALALNPVVIFVGIFFWGWLWGVAGALLAVPMLLTFKIFCDHVEPLAPIGEFLGR